jgi:hypothetical protein
VEGGRRSVTGPLLPGGRLPFPPVPDILRTGSFPKTTDQV